jgi:hypothetical protein
VITKVGKDVDRKSLYIAGGVSAGTGQRPCSGEMGMNPLSMRYLHCFAGSGITHNAQKITFVSIHRSTDKHNMAYIQQDVN